MANQVPNSTVGLLINNPSPQPDGSVGNPNISALVAGGTNQLTATTLSAPQNVVSGAGAGNGVILPVGSKAQTVTVMPSTATTVLRVFPPVNGTINFGTPNALVSIPAQRETTFRSIDSSGLNWVSSTLTA